MPPKSDDVLIEFLAAHGALDGIEIQNPADDLEGRMLINEFYNRIEGEKTRLLEQNAYQRFVG